MTILLPANIQTRKNWTCRDEIYFRLRRETIHYILNGKCRKNYRYMIEIEIIIPNIDPIEPSPKLRGMDQEFQ